MATSKNLTQSRTPQKAGVEKPVSEQPRALKVIPKRAGFRRAGYAFPDGETVIALADLSDKQYEQLTSEPMLVTFLVDLPDADAATV